MQGQLYIDGQFAKGGAAPFAVYNPYNLSQIGTQQAAAEDDVKRAINVAEQAFKALKTTTAFARADALETLYQAMIQAESILAETMTIEQGKPLKEAIGEVRYAASYVKWYAQEAGRVQGDILASNHPKSRLHVYREPVGPVALITPWNFPLAMFVRKLAPAFAAGCSVIVKPASQTPFSAVKFFELINQIPLLKASCQLLSGDAKVIGELLIDDMRIRKLSFTGSSAVGVKLAAKSAATLKRVSLELGGHAPLIVFADANLDKAVKGTIISKFRNCGQACIASNRIYVHHKIKADFVAKLKAAVAAIKAGNGLDNVDIGPIIDEAAYGKLALQVDDALAKGASLLAGGQGYRTLSGSGGYIYPATVLDDVDENMQVATEETFGPILPLLTFNDDDEVIKRANATPYGLAAYAYTENLSRATYAIENLEYGMVGINTGVLGTAQAPFGGVKMSGYGREGGKYGIDEYLQIKYANIGI